MGVIVYRRSRMSLLTIEKESMQAAVKESIED